ncbi:2-acyl-glycerophospho-ethanolamine acyltransferase [Bacillus infantis]|uniref:2-acyl-glycerophospho-ethanolamine acyltransferase n=1 Tax=Bacillus infantis TaxID=324767 RepID=UPI0037BFE21B
MERKNLKIFTKISFIIAIVTIIVIPISIYTPIPKVIGLLVFLISLIGIPFSIISMFSREKLAKRIFALIVNLLPISLFIYALIMEFTDEFLRTAP